MSIFPHIKVHFFLKEFKSSTVSWASHYADKMFLIFDMYHCDREPPITINKTVLLYNKGGFQELSCRVFSNRLKCLGKVTSLLEKLLPHINFKLKPQYPFLH